MWRLRNWEPWSMRKILKILKCAWLLKAVLLRSLSQMDLSSNRRRNASLCRMNMKEYHNYLKCFIVSKWLRITFKTTLWAHWIPDLWQWTAQAADQRPWSSPIQLDSRVARAHYPLQERTRQEQARPRARPYHLRPQSAKRLAHARAWLNVAREKSHPWKVREAPGGVWAASDQNQRGNAQAPGTRGDFEQQLSRERRGVSSERCYDKEPYIKAAGDERPNPKVLEVHRSVERSKGTGERTQGRKRVLAAGKRLVRKEFVGVKSNAGG